MATIPSLPLFTSGPLTSGKLNRLRDVIALWQNPPAAMARASASQNITTGGAYQLVTLHTTEFDTDTIVTSTTRFTVKTAGRYLIAATATFSANGTGSRYVTVRKNAAGSPTGGTVIASGASAPSAGSSTTVSLPANLRTQLAVNDTLEVFVFQDSGATLTLNSSPGDTFMLLQLDSVTATMSGTEATNIQSLHAESDLSTGDLDSVLSPGNYVQATAANATLARHYPVASVGGHLQVQSDGTASPTSTTQMFETTANALYIRHRAGTTWSAWAAISGGTVSDATTTSKGIVQLAGDLAGTAAAPSVAKVNGVAVTGTPTSGQVLTASSGTAAAWSTPASGGAVDFVAVKKTADQSTADQTVTTITWDSETEDASGYHDNVTSNSRLTVPTGKAGVFMVTLVIGYQGASGTTGQRSAILLKNGVSLTDTAVQAINNATGDPTIVQLVTTVRLAAADYIEAQAWQNSGGARNILATRSSLVLTRLGS